MITPKRVLLVAVVCGCLVCFAGIAVWLMLNQNPLRNAAIAGDAKEAERLLATGVTVDDADEVSGTTPLQMAAAYGHEDVLDLLLRHGANVSARDTGGRTALHWAAEGGTPAIVQSLVVHQADVNVQDASGETPLHIAAARGALEVVAILLSARADISVLDKEGETALAEAAVGRTAGHVETVRLLLDHGAKTDLGIGCGLGTAAARGNLEIVRLLLDSKPDLSKGDVYGHTPLHLAASEGQSQIVTMLIHAGANVNAPDKAGRTPLDWALIDHHEDVARILRDSGGLSGTGPAIPPMHGSK